MMWLAWAVSAVLLFVAGLIRAGGASLIRTHRADALHDLAEGNQSAGRVAELLEDRAGLQPSMGPVHSAVMVAAVIPAAWALTNVAQGGVLAASLIALGAAVLILGDLVPRSIGRSSPRLLAYRLVRLLTVVVALGSAANDLVLDEDEADDETEDDRDEQDLEELELIASVLEFSHTLVREVMVPRTDMVSISSQSRSDVAADLVIEHGFSRIPVTGVSSDDIVGIVFAKDLLQHLDEGPGPMAVTDLMREPYFVPETKRVLELLRDMQSNKNHLAVVVDEFGGTAGLVSIEDLLEELVGEIVDEYDTEEPLVVEQADGSLRVDARLPVEDLAELVDEEFPEDGWDTVGGLVLGLAGRVPHEDESFDFGAVRLVCTRVQGRRVAEVVVERIGPARAAQ